MTKTRIAYGYHRESGKLLVLSDTIEAALKANMMVRDYEKALIDPSLLPLSRGWEAEAKEKS